MEKLKPIPKVELENPEFEYKRKETSIVNPAPQEKKYMGDDLNLFRNVDSDIVDKINELIDEVDNLPTSDVDKSYVDSQDQKLQDQINNEGSRITQNHDDILKIQLDNIDRDSDFATNKNNIDKANTAIDLKESIVDHNTDLAKVESAIDDINNVKLPTYELKTEHKTDIDNINSKVDYLDKTIGHDFTSDTYSISYYLKDWEQKYAYNTIKQEMEIIDNRSSRTSVEWDRFASWNARVLAGWFIKEDTYPPLNSNVPQRLGTKLAIPDQINDFEFRITDNTNKVKNVSDIEQNWNGLSGNRPSDVRSHWQLERALKRVEDQIKSLDVKEFALQTTYSVDNDGTTNPQITITEFKNSDYDNTLDYMFEGYVEVEFDDPSILPMSINIYEKLSGGNYVYKRSLGITLPNGMLLESQLQVIFDNNGTTYKIDGIWHNSPNGTIPIDFQNIGGTGFKWTKMTLTNARIYSVDRGNINATRKAKK